MSSRGVAGDVAPGVAPRLPVNATSLAASLTLAVLTLAIAPEARAFSANEHTRISALALTDEKLIEKRFDAEQRKTLADLWTAALASPRVKGAHLCPTIDFDELSKARAPTCISFASLAALAGDHTCNVPALVSTLNDKAGLPLAILRLAYAYDQRLGRVHYSPGSWQWRSSFQGIRRDFDLDLLATDGSYYARAQQNRTHFQLPRGAVEGSLDAYLREALAPGAPPNAAATYVAYHLAARKYALKALAKGTADASEQALQALLHEAYALHFLQDGFAAGHLVDAQGPNEPPGLRQGTHDYYCAHGYPMITWGGEAYAGYGDGFATRADYEHAAAAVRASLAQLATVARGGEGEAAPPDVVDTIDLGPPPDSCKVSQVPPVLIRVVGSPVIREVLVYQPAPAASNPSPPHFTNETGPFLLIATTIQAGATFTPFADAAPGARFVGDVSLSIGVGFGLEGVISSRRDGLAFLAATVSGQARGADELLGVGAHLRFPFALLPGDFLVWGPAALLESDTSVPSWSVRAAKLASMDLLSYELSEKTLLRADLGREVLVQFLFAPETRRYRGFEFTLPLASLRLHAFDWDVASDETLGLSLRIGHDPVIGTFLGPTLAYAHVSRRYRF